MAESVNNPTASVIIPTLNAGCDIDPLLDLLEHQRHAPMEILVVDSASDDDTVSRVAAHGNVRLLTIQRSDFNHGLTRDMAFRQTRGDYVLFLTQDAVPADDRLIQNIMLPMIEDPLVAQVSGRQLPKNEARPFERLVRTANYPAESNKRALVDVPKMGIKAFYTSDVCCCYRRSAYLKVGGFTRTDMSEDMLMSIKLIKAGYRVAYAADAQVFHSHNFTPKQQFKRNKAVGIFLEEHADELNGISEVGDGVGLVKHVSRQLISKGQFGELVAFGIDCTARLLGNRAGRALVRNRR